MLRPWAPESPRKEDVCIGRGKSPRWGTRGMQNPRGIWGMPQNPRAEQSKVLRREAAGPAG